MTRAAIEKNRVTLAALIIVIVAGFSAYRTLPQDEDPGFIIRTALVMTYFPGASPSRVENLVTDKIEEMVQEIPELDYVASQSRTGVSLVYVNIKQRYKNIRPIWDNLRRKVDGVVGELPDGVIGPIVNDEFGDVFGILMMLTGEGFNYAELKEVADEVRDELLRLPDASKVEIFGAQEERVFVEYNNVRLAELGLSVQQLSQILESRNIIIPGGEILLGAERVSLEPSGNFETIEDLRKTVIKLPDRPEVVYLDDLAKISRSYIDPPQRKVRESGVPALGIGVSLREGGNVLTLGQDVQRTIGRLESLYPIGIEFTTIADQPTRVERKVDEFAGNLLQAVAIVLVVMLLSLGLRTGLVVASLIPAAMLMTLMVMGFFGIGLNQMSLAALIIALGMLIDNAIVMSESIMVQMGAGTPPLQAAVAAGAELRVPLLTSSLTTAAAFLPIFLAKSMSGEYTGVIFSVVTIALLCSWVLALTITPLLCVKFLRVKKETGETDPFSSRFYVAYRATLTWVLGHRAVALLAILGMFLGAMSAFRFVPVLFFPEADRAFFTAKLELPAGTAIEATEKMVDEIEAFIEQNLWVDPENPERAEGITEWASFIGGGEPKFILTFNPEQAKPSYAFMIIKTTSYEVVAGMIEQLEEFCWNRFPDLIAAINPSNMGPPVDKPVQVRISGRDEDQIFNLADLVEEKLESIPGTRNVKDNWGRRTKKLVVEVNQPRARRAGVTSRDVAISLQSLLSGIESTQYREESDIIPITLRSVAADREDIGKLESLNVYSQTTGRPVPLRQVADIRVEWEPAEIFRRDRIKTVTVDTELAPGVTATEVTRELIPWLDEQSASWPRGYTYELGGENETSGKANASIQEQLPVAGLIIVILLVGQFNSFRKPLIIMATIPLGMIGVISGLLMTGSFFGFMTLLGIISLAGIVINNAIVLLDRIRIEVEENGLSPQSAIIEAAQRRLRPILLTTVTTVGGMLPLWMGGGPMWEPMAIAIIFGLLFATLLTLGFVPILYSLLYRVSFAGFVYQRQKGIESKA
jgi:multidrug efflux pump